LQVVLVLQSTVKQENKKLTPQKLDAYAYVWYMPYIHMAYAIRICMVKIS